MSSQGEMLDSNMVGLTGNQEDERLEERTGTARAFPAHNSICGHCVQNDESPTFIKHANQKVYRGGHPMCLDCFNRSSGDKPIKMKQFQKLSHQEHNVTMKHLNPESCRLTQRAAANAFLMVGIIMVCIQVSQHDHTR